MTSDENIATSFFNKNKISSCFPHKIKDAISFKGVMIYRGGI